MPGVQAARLGEEMNLFTGAPQTDAPVRLSSHGLSASARRPGKMTGNAGVACTHAEAQKHAMETRNTVRAAALVKATAYIRQVAGGEKRSIRRAMARDYAKRVLREVA